MFSDNVLHHRQPHQAILRRKAAWRGGGSKSSVEISPFPCSKKQKCEADFVRVQLHFWIHHHHHSTLCSTCTLLIDIMIDIYLRLRGLVIAADPPISFSLTGGVLARRVLMLLWGSGCVDCSILCLFHTALFISTSSC